MKQNKCSIIIRPLTTTVYSKHLSLFGIVKICNKFVPRWKNLDVFEWARQQRPNPKWIVMDITNATFYVTKLRDHPTGRSTRLPKYVLENSAIVSLDCNEHTGLPYEDKLCFFRCLALHRGCHAHNLERDTQHYFERYAEDGDDFDGVTLEGTSRLGKIV